MRLAKPFCLFLVAFLLGCGGGPPPPPATPPETIDTFKLQLEHFHFDTFTTRGDPLVNNQQIVFFLGADGEVEKLSFLDQEFKKVKPKPAQPK